MTTTELEPATRLLPPDSLACIDCGVPVPLVPGVRPLVVSTTKPPSRALIDVRLLRCASCQDTYDATVAAVEQMPGLAAKLGTEGARHRLSSALVALAVLGRPAPANLSDRMIAATLIRHLSTPGACARWIAALAPTLSVLPTSCSSEPWSHVPDDVLSAARAGYAGLLAERVAMKAAPVVLTPPSAPDSELARGCLYCGIGALALDADEAVRSGGQESARWIAWRPITISTPASIGAPPSAQPVKGWLCPPCANVVDEMAVVGQSSMEKALKTYLAEAGRSDELRLITGGELTQIASWAGFVLRQRRRGRPVPGPNRKPWAHLVIG